LSGRLLFNAKWAVLQLYHGENKLHPMKWWRCSLCSRPTRWIFIALDYWNNIPRVNVSLPRTHHSASEPTMFLFLLHNVFCTVEKNQIPILKSSVSPDRSSNPRPTALETSTLTFTPPMRFMRLVASYCIHNHIQTQERLHWYCQYNTLKNTNTVKSV
jgi:hypothetical protein